MFLEMCLFVGIIISYYLMFIPTLLLITFVILIIQDFYSKFMHNLHMIEYGFKGYDLREYNDP